MTQGKSTTPSSTVPPLPRRWSTIVPSVAVVRSGALDDLFDLNGRVAIVTGSTQGIGRACAERLCEHGARVVFSSRTLDDCRTRASAANERAGEERAVGIACDMGDPAQIRALVAQTADQWGRVDIVVGNAKDEHPGTSWIEKVDPDEMTQWFVGNVTNNLILAQAAVPLMRQVGGGSIVFNASTAGVAALEDYLPYGVAKASLIHMARILAVQLGPFDIRVNCVSPGPIAAARARHRGVGRRGVPPGRDRSLTARTPRHLRRDRGGRGVAGVARRSLRHRAEHRDRRRSDPEGHAGAQRHGDPAPTAKARHHDLRCDAGLLDHQGLHRYLRSQRERVRDARRTREQPVTVEQLADVYYDPFDQGIFADPYRTYRRLRDEAPLYHNDQYGFYAVSRADDVQRVIVDRANFSSANATVLEWLLAGIEVPPGMFIWEDAPRHTRHRGVLSRVFTPRRVAEIEPQVRAFTRRTLDRLVGRDEFDFVADIGVHIPIRVIGMVLGIPEDDQQSIRDESAIASHNEAGQPAEHTPLDGHLYEEYIDWRADHPSDDLMTDLLNVTFEDESGETRKLTRAEVLTFVMLLDGAGAETTATLIALGRQGARRSPRPTP